MLTIEQIHEAHSKVKRGADFPLFVQDLKVIGVTHYDNYVADGNTIYYGSDNFALQSESKYPSMHVNDESSAEILK